MVKNWSRRPAPRSTRYRPATPLSRVQSHPKQQPPLLTTMFFRGLCASRGSDSSSEPFALEVGLSCSQLVVISPVYHKAEKIACNEDTLPSLANLGLVAQGVSVLRTDIINPNRTGVTTHPGCITCWPPRLVFVLNQRKLDIRNDCLRVQNLALESEGPFLVRTEAAHDLVHITSTRPTTKQNASAPT